MERGVERAVAKDDFRSEAEQGTADITASDQQHKSGRPGQEKESRTNIADNGIAQRNSAELLSEKQRRKRVSAQETRHGVWDLGLGTWFRFVRLYPTKCASGY